MFTRTQIFWSFDLLQLNFLPPDWIAQIQRIIAQHGTVTALNGSSSTSREPKGSSEVDLTVVTGDRISQSLPWLFSLYYKQLARFASEYAGRKVSVAKDLIASVNINLMAGLNSRYERHVDSNPVTGILFVNSLLPEDGGELIFETKQMEVSVTPRSGIFLTFDARKIVHYVAPLKTAVQRISIPMNYYFDQVKQNRPTDLDRYLYKTNAKS